MIVIQTDTCKITHNRDRTSPMDQLLCNRRLVCRCVDWIAVRRGHTHWWKAARRCGGSRRRICHTERSSFLRRLIVVSCTERAVVGNRNSGHRLGSRGSQWNRIRIRCHSPHERANRLQARLWRLAVPLLASLCVILNAFSVCVRCPHSSTPRIVLDCCRYALALIHRHSQRLGRCNVSPACP